MEDSSKIYAEALKRGYSFAPKGSGGYRLVYPKLGGRDKNFESRLKENWTGTKAYLNTKNPSNLKPTEAAKAAMDKTKGGEARSSLARLNDEFNKSYQGFVGQTPDPTIRYLLQNLMPKSATGKAVGLATLPFAAPESLLGAAAGVGIPALVGGAAGAASGEGALSGAAQGATSGALGAIPEGVGAISSVAKSFIGRAGKMREIDNARMSETFGNIVNLPGIWRKLKSGKSTWADVFASRGSVEEAGLRLMKSQDEIGSNLAQIGSTAADAAEKDFEKKYGMSLTKAIRSPKDKIDKKTLQAALKAKDNINFLKTANKRFENYIRTARGLGKAAFKDGIDEDVLRDTPTAARTADSYKQVKSKLLDELDQFNSIAKQMGMAVPGMRSAYEQTNKQYAQFAAIRDMADHALVQIKKKVPIQRAMQDLLRENPRPLEQRLSDAFQPVKDAIRRGAADVEDSDIPSFIQQMRLFGHNITRPGFSATASALRHPAGKYIGERSMGAPATILEQLKEFNPGLLSSVGRPVVSETVNKAIDTTRDENAKQ